MISCTLFNFSSENLIISTFLFSRKDAKISQRRQDLSTYKHTNLTVQLTGDHIHATHRDHRIAQQTTRYNFRECLVINEAGTTEVQTVRSATTIADEVKTKLSITAFHTIIYF